MSCKSCKGAKSPTQPSTYSTRVQINNFILKMIVFLFMMCLMPVFVLALVLILFNSIVLSKNIDIIPAFRHLIIKLGKKKEIDDQDDIEPDDEEYEMMDVEKIK